MTMDPSRAIEILLVEDNPHDADLTIRALKKRNLANNLIHVEDGAAALDLVFNRGPYAQTRAPERPRLILLDVKLPKRDGLEVLRELKSHPETRGIPVIMVTSSSEDPDIRLAYELGANSYVVKPVDFEAFQKAIEDIGLYWLLLNQQ
jgi:two-component system, response regulator